MAEREGDNSITEGCRQSEAEACGPIESASFWAYRRMSLSPRRGGAKCWMHGMSARGVTRPQARAGGGLGSGEVSGRLSGLTRRKGGDMRRERMFDAQACTGGCAIPGGKPGTPAPLPFQLL